MDYGLELCILYMIGSIELIRYTSYSISKVYMNSRNPKHSKIEHLQAIGEFVQENMTIHSFWMTKSLEDILDTYSQEWEQFTIKDAIIQPCMYLLDMMCSWIFNYAKDPILYFSYHIMINMLHFFENNSF